VEDNAFVHLRNAAGQVAQIHSSATLWKHTFQMDLGLQGGYLSVRGLLSKTGSYGRETLVVGRKSTPGKAGAAGNPPEEVIYYDRDDSWKKQMESFVHCIRKDAPVPESTSQDAFRLMELIGKVYGKAVPAQTRTPKPASQPAGGVPGEIQAIRQGTEDEEFKEEEIWPARLVAKYRAMLAREAGRIYGLPGNLKTCACPACGCDRHRLLFALGKAQYRSCDRCESWFVSPRPKEAVMAAWRKGGAARKFWNQTLLPVARKTRKETMILPRARWVRRWLEVEGGLAEGVHFPANPDPDLVKSLQDLGVPLKQGAPAAIWFEHLDREVNPASALRALTGTLPPGGKIFMTGWLSTGFDVSMLGASHPGINPLERLNLFSPEGIRQMARQCGLTVAEFSTPGALDLQIVRKHMPRNGKHHPSPFLNFLLQKGGSNLEHEFMSFLQGNRLSSHGRMVLKKK
jgi:hypothetical protein